MDTYTFHRICQLQFHTVNDIADLTRCAEREYPKISLRLQFQDMNQIDARDFIGICANSHNRCIIEIRPAYNCTDEQVERLIAYLKSHFDVTNL